MTLAPFGQPGSVTRDTFDRLPEAMQCEGILLLSEMGQSWREIDAALGLDPAGRNAILRHARPYLHPTQIPVVGGRE